MNHREDELNVILEGIKRNFKIGCVILTILYFKIF